jgi:hypothetical protein
MSKRSRRIAKRDEFENTLKEMEKKIRSRSGKNPVATTPGMTGQNGESERVEIHNPGKEDSE